MSNEYFNTGLNLAPAVPVEDVKTISEYTGVCSCGDPGDCSNCPDKEYDQGGEG